MKKIKVLLIFFISILLCSFVSCVKEKENEQNEYQVIFNLMGGTFNDSEESVVMKLKENELVDVITPVKAGYKFGGWSSKLSASMVNDCDFTKGITSSSVVYAIWSLPQISYELNGGFFTRYNSFEELVNDFINDYKNRRDWISAEWFFDASWNTVNDFFQNKSFFDKWKPLLEYIKAVSLNTTCNRQINNILDGKFISDEDYAELRMNIHNFLNRLSKHDNENYNYLSTIDYSKEENITKVWNYFKKDASPYYDSTSTYVLPVPFSNNKKFVGWYANSQFTGEKVTEIPEGTITDLKYYALWA